MRTRYRWNPETQRQEPIAQTEGYSSGLIIMPDIPDFVSPVDGRVVHGRKGLRDHNKELNVTNADDYKEEWKAKAAERARFYSGDKSYDRKDRVEALKHAFEKHRRT
jgi:hypothetical protein